jgi:hypothetical protein
MQGASSQRDDKSLARASGSANPSRDGLLEGPCLQGPEIGGQREECGPCKQGPSKAFSVVASPAIPFGTKCLSIHFQIGPRRGFAGLRIDPLNSDLLENGLSLDPLP